MRPQFSKTIIIPVAALVLTLILAAIMFSPRPSVRVKVLDPRFHLISAGVLHGTNDFIYLGNPLEGRVRDFLRMQAHQKVNTLAQLRASRVPRPPDVSFVFGPAGTFLGSEPSGTSSTAILLEVIGGELPPFYNFAGLSTESRSKDDLALVICYKWDAGPGGANHGLTAGYAPSSSEFELVDTNGAVIGIPRLSRATEPSFVSWQLNSGSLISGRCVLRLKTALWTNGVGIANSNALNLAELEIRDWSR